MLVTCFRSTAWYHHHQRQLIGSLVVGAGRGCLWVGKEWEWGGEWIVVVTMTIQILFMR